MSNDIPSSTPPATTQATAIAPQPGSRSAAISGVAAGNPSLTGDLPQGIYLRNAILQFRSGEWHLTNARTAATTAIDAQAGSTQNDVRQEIRLPADLPLPAAIKAGLQQTSANSTPLSGSVAPSLPVLVEIKVSAQQVLLALQLPAQSGQLSLPLNLSEQQAQQLLSAISSKLAQGYSRATAAAIEPALSAAQLKTLAQLFTVSVINQRWQLHVNNMTIPLPDPLQAKLPALTATSDSASGRPQLEVIQVTPTTAQTDKSTSPPINSASEALRQIAVALRWQQGVQTLAQLPLSKALGQQFLGVDARPQQLSLPLINQPTVSGLSEPSLLLQMPDGQRLPLPSTIRQALLKLTPLPAELSITKQFDGIRLQLPAASGPPSLNLLLSESSSIGKLLAGALATTATTPTQATTGPRLTNAQPGQLTLAAAPPAAGNQANTHVASDGAGTLIQQLAALSKGAQPLDMTLARLQQLVSGSTTSSDATGASNRQPADSVSLSPTLSHSLKSLSEQLLQQVPQVSQPKTAQVQQWIMSQWLFQPFAPQLLATTVAALRGVAPVQVSASDTLGLLMNLLFSGRLSTLLNKASAASPTGKGRSFESLAPTGGAAARMLQSLQQAVGHTAQQSQLYQAQSSESGSNAPSYFSLPISDGGLFRQIEGRIDPPREDDADKAQPQTLKSWQLTLKLDVGEQGELLAQARLHQQQLKLRLIASKGGLKRQVDNHIATLDQRLQQLGFATEIACRQGAVPATLRPQANQLVTVKV